ncbi:glycosyltransferase [Pseudarthrobacter sp. DSP2-3-2b1]|uniref:glycosyltransferase n=1 Tax=Pseudarthrobacter sp. DSP2-3-2b1 TaxID=2804661 RepID=UPI003CEECF73
MSDVTRVLVFIPGSRWENVSGTDHQLALTLAGSVPVLWVDPPLPFHHALRTHDLPQGRLELSKVADGITRLRSLSLPGFTRRLVAPFTSRLLSADIRTSLVRLGVEAKATLLSSPISRFPSGLTGPNLLYVTDDWAAGATMMRLAPSLVEKTLQANVATARHTAAVSPALAALVDSRIKDGRRATAVVPNGCAVTAPQEPAPDRTPTAVLIGQLNERLDMDLLAALDEARVPILVIGPRTEHDRKTSRLLDTFLGSDNVAWLGRLPLAETRKHLATARVGLTPYRDNAFNRASFPLKTLDYLAAGLPVVATDLPAVRWLETDLVSICKTKENFVRQVQQELATAPNTATEADRRTFAAGHSWHERARQLMSVIEGREKR